MVSNGKVTFAVCVGVVLIIAAGLVAGRNASLRAAGTDEQAIRGLVFAVYPNGFAPPEITANPGIYTFIVHNRTGLPDFRLRLDRQNGERLSEVRTNKRRWNGRFDLKPGTYVLSVAEHPAWQCVITVNPN
jgi:hypothetical protein